MHAETKHEMSNHPTFPLAEKCKICCETVVNIDINEKWQLLVSLTKGLACVISENAYN